MRTFTMILRVPLWVRDASAAGETRLCVTNTTGLMTPAAGEHLRGGQIPPRRHTRGRLLPAWSNGRLDGRVT